MSYWSWRGTSAFAWVSVLLGDACLPACRLSPAQGAPGAGRTPANAPPAPQQSPDSARPWRVQICKSRCAQGSCNSSTASGWRALEAGKALRGTMPMPTPGADHAADGLEAAHLNAHIQMLAQRGSGVHGEGVDGRAGVQHDKGMLQHLGKAQRPAPGQGVVLRGDEHQPVAPVGLQLHAAAINGAAIGQHAQLDLAVGHGQGNVACLARSSSVTLTWGCWRKKLARSSGRKVCVAWVLAHRLTWPRTPLAKGERLACICSSAANTCRALRSRASPARVRATPRAWR